MAKNLCCGAILLRHIVQGADEGGKTDIDLDIYDLYLGAISLAIRG